MSLAINPSRIRHVKIGGEWLEVAWKNGKSTFYVDAYEFVYPADDPMHDNSDIVYSPGLNGFEFTTKDSSSQLVCGPMSAIEAVWVDEG